jgi:UDP-N-acetylglucosamine 2-epimerase (non-hydrolysing)
VRPPRILCVAGARPNFAKIKPVLDAFEAYRAKTVFVHTGQHYDAAMSTQFIDELGLRAPDYHLGVGSGTHAEQTAKVMTGVEALVDEAAPDAVVVVGDVNSTMAAALVGTKGGALVAHVEAGLRSRNWTMPEEINRVVTDRVSDLLLAPSDDACANLRGEGADPANVHLAGNVMVDTLLANLDRAAARPALENLGLQPHGYGLVTLHRPSNVDHAEDLAGLVRALGEIAEHLPLVFPAHPRTAACLTRHVLPSSLQVIEPAGYLDFLALQANARLVLTDSGGIQEETTVLGVPCLTARESTERPITVHEGTNQVVGTDPDAIVRAALNTLEQPPAPRRPPLWDGQAGHRVAGAVIDRLAHGDPASQASLTDASVPSP